MGFARARARAGVSQQEVAAYLGVTQGAVSQWENGLSRPSIKRLSRLAELYGCTIEELLKEGEHDSQVLHRASSDG